MTYGLPQTTLAQINGVLARFSEVEKAVLFGSRAKGMHKRGSDIDLALVGSQLDWRQMGRIEDALDDLLLPYQFSLIILGKRTDPGVSGDIGRVGVTIYERESATSGA